MKVLQEIRALQEGSVSRTVTVVEVCMMHGAKVKGGDTVIELETSKCTFTIDARESGYIEYFCRKGDEVAIGEVIARITDVAPPNPRAVPGPGSQARAKTPAQKGPVFSEKAQELMKKNGISASVFADKDFVDGADVQAYINGKKGSPPHPLGRDDETFHLKAQSGWVELKKHSAAKKEEIANLSIIHKGGLSSTINVVVEMEGIHEAVNNNLTYFKDSILPLVVYESARLLKKYPAFNAFNYKDGVAYYKDVHIGVAVDIDKSLKVVSVRDPDKMTIAQVEEALYDLVNRYMDNKLEISDLIDTTFTIADLSVHGAHSFVPLINAHQSAILGIAAVDKRLMRCVLTLTFDHRVSCGKEASWFLCELKERLESFAQCQKDTSQRPQGEKAGIRCQRCLKSLAEDAELNGGGLLKVVDHDGKETYMCRGCFLGW